MPADEKHGDRLRFQIGILRLDGRGDAKLHDSIGVGEKKLTTAGEITSGGELFRVEAYPRAIPYPEDSRPSPRGEDRRLTISSKRSGDAPRDLGWFAVEGGEARAKRAPRGIILRWRFVDFGIINSRERRRFGGRNSLVIQVSAQSDPGSRSRREQRR